MKWFKFHPVTCAAMTATIIMLSLLNGRRQVFFGPGSTSVLKFAHGWPVSFQEGPVPDPSASFSKQKEIAPNWIWGHPEFNDDPKIMAMYGSYLKGLPRTPWGLHALGKRNASGAAFDLTVALLALVAVTFLCEIEFESSRRRLRNWLPFSLVFSAVAVSTLLLSAYSADAWRYVVPAFVVVVSSIVVTGAVLAFGHR